MWRDTALRLRFVIFDAWSMVPFLLFAFHWSWWTLETAAATAVVLFVLEQLGLDLQRGVRWLRSVLVGRVRTAIPHARKRRLA
jgi:hypothetical protein